jgi:hypothetical protein
MSLLRVPYDAWRRCFLLLGFGCVLCTKELNAWSRVLLKTLTITQLVKKYPALYGTRSFTTLPIRAGNCSLSWAKWIQSTSFHIISLISILILSSHLCLRSKFFSTFLMSPVRSTYPTQLALLDFITLIIFGAVYELRRSSVCSLLQSLR